jgi:hypothetical protein
MTKQRREKNGFIYIGFIFSENERGKQPENLMFGVFLQYRIRAVTAFKKR